MESIAAALTEIADEISAFGVPAVVDSRDLVLPGAWVTLQSVGFDYLAGSSPYTLTVVVFLIARDLGTPAALDDLSELLDQLVEPVKITDATATTIVLPNQGADPLPALSFTLETRVTE